MFTAVLLFAAVSVVGSQGQLSRTFRAQSGTPPVYRWSGPFVYTREFNSSTSACDFHGRERVSATLDCNGTDLDHLTCRATGVAEHTYAESLANGAKRTDSGVYEGPLQTNYKTSEIHGFHLFNLDVGSNVPVQFQHTNENGSAKQGAYVLNVAGSTDQEVFQPQLDRIEWRRVDPIFEPGPAACGATGYNGKSSVELKLLPVEESVQTARAAH